MMHWATQYIGSAWKSGAQGPSAFDCWGFVRYILQVHYDIAVPHIAIPENQHAASKLMVSSPELANWIQTDTMCDGCIVMMARRHVPLHIGLCIDANNTVGILHCAEPAGVLFQTLHGIKSSGFGRLTYFRRKPQ